MKNVNKINAEIGGRIKTARETAHLTQEQFSELIDMGPKNVPAVGRGLAGVPVPALMRICKVLSVSSDTLLFGAPYEYDMSDLISKLKQFSPAEYKIAVDILDSLLQALAISKK